MFNPHPQSQEFPLQVTNSKRISDFGSLLLILQRTTASSGKDTMKELQHGSFRVAYWVIGYQLGRYYGFTGNVRSHYWQRVACIDSFLILQRDVERAHFCMWSIDGRIHDHSLTLPISSAIIQDIARKRAA